MKQHRLFVTLFILILALPSLDVVFHFSPVEELFEKRIAQPFPAGPKNISELVKYPRAFEAFYNDNYGFRKTLISLNSAIADKIFNESPDDRAVIGKEGWLYFDNKKSLLDAVGKASIDDALIMRGIDAFYHNWQAMKAKNIDYLLVIAADKSSIYPEYLPEYLTYQKPHRIDAFLEALKAKYPDFPVLDLRPLLKEAKKEEVIYHKTDTHWNMLGAYVGYRAIMDRLGIRAHLKSDYEISYDSDFHGDIAQIMNAKSKERSIRFKERFVKTYQRIKTKTDTYNHFHKAKAFVNSRQDLPTLFAYKDSFFGNLIYLFPTHFAQSTYVNEFPCHLDEKIIKPHLSAQGPNIVIQQFWEARIEDVLKACK